MTPDEFVDGAWAGEPCLIIGGGPSVGHIDLSEIPLHWRVIAINRALELEIEPDIWLFMDDNLYTWSIEGQLGERMQKAVENYRGLTLARKVRAKEHIYPDSVHRITWQPGSGLGRGVEAAFCSNNSGYWAINIAYSLGADPIILVGFDCDVEGKDDRHDTVEWWHDGYPQFVNAGTHKKYAYAFDKLADWIAKEDVRVWNIGELTKVEAFERITLEKAIERTAPAVR